MVTDLKSKQKNKKMKVLWIKFVENKETLRKPLLVTSRLYCAEAYYSRSEQVKYKCNLQSDPGFSFQPFTKVLTLEGVSVLS